MIELKGISFKYKNQKELLHNINLEIKENEIVSIIGKNGAGKSTLAKIMAGILKPTKGCVFIDDLDAYNKKNFKSIRKNVGIVFQNPDNQILFNNVYDDVSFSLKNLEIDEKEFKIKDALAKVDMSGFEQADTYKLSLGQKQRINIASSLAVNPKYLILDEPTTMIDSKGKEKIYKIIRELKDNKKTIIYITNNINEILLSDRIIIMENGQIVNSLKKEDLLNNTEILSDLDICVPDIIKLILILNDNGFNINLQDYTIEELSSKIIEVLKK